jgi:hypothetical protein
MENVGSAEAVATERKAVQHQQSEGRIVSNLGGKAANARNSSSFASDRLQVEVVFTCFVRLIRPSGASLLPLHLIAQSGCRCKMDFEEGRTKAERLLWH